MVPVTNNPTGEGNPELVSSSEAATLLRMSVRKVQRLAREGKLRYVRQLPGPTGAYLFSRKQLVGETGDTDEHRSS